MDINFHGKNDEVAAVAKSLRVLDHHKSELAELDGKPYATFDINRSGAGLAWDFLIGIDSPAQFISGPGFFPKRPWWVDYVEDRDLWRFNLPDSRMVNAFIMSHTYSIENWDKIAKTKIENAQIGGMFLVQLNQKNAEEVALQAQFGRFNGYRAAVVNAPYILANDVGEILYQRPDVDIAMVWFERNDGRIQISLRSMPGVGPDVGEIAVSFPGGGGHRHAAGIPPTLEDGRSLIDSILGRK